MVSDTTDHVRFWAAAPKGPMTYAFTYAEISPSPSSSYPPQIPGPYLSLKTQTSPRHSDIFDTPPPSPAQVAQNALEGYENRGLGCLGLPPGPPSLPQTSPRRPGNPMFPLGRGGRATDRKPAPTGADRRRPTARYPKRRLLGKFRLFSNC